MRGAGSFLLPFFFFYLGRFTFEKRLGEAEQIGNTQVQTS